MLVSVPSMPRRWRAVFWSLIVACRSVTAFAQEETPSPEAPSPEAPPPPSPPPLDPQAQKLEHAKELFRQGNALRKAGDYERALEFYQASRQELASAPNTLNAAYCLEKLGRSAEALELYEELLTRFNDQLGAEEREAVATSMSALRPRVGSIEVAANATGLVVVDGRMRGTLPLAGPIRVEPGKRVVRVIKDGYEMFETSVDVRAGATASVDARLKPLLTSGQLRIEDQALTGAEVFVDGASVGRVPWQGTLAPGKHLYWLQRADEGSAPAVVAVVEGQLVRASAKLEPLSRDLRLVPSPPSALLFLDGVPLGRGVFQGRLTVGTHKLEAREEGYLPATVNLGVDRTTSGDQGLKLRPDLEHPRWAVPQRARFTLQAEGGLLIASSLNSGAERSCERHGCSQDDTALGPWLAARLGYQLPVRVAFELGVGYLALGKELVRSRSEDQAVPVPVTFEYEDDISLRGPFMSLGASYFLPLGSSFALTGRLDAGAVLARTSDEIEAEVSGEGDSTGASVQGAGEPVSSVAAFIAPALGARLALGSAHVGLALALPWILTPGPDNEHGETRLPPCDPARPVTCVSRTDHVRAERTYGNFLAILPLLSAGYTFD